MTTPVADAVTNLRCKLVDCKPPDGLGCVSFVGAKVYQLGIAFFPGGPGLIDPSRKAISTLIVGSDWGNQRSFEAMLRRPIHRDETLYRGVRSMLEPAGYDLADAFYTNAWPVLRQGDTNESGYHRMRDHKCFTRDCRSFFVETLRELQPRLVITLGIGPAWFVSPFVGSMWRPSKFLSSIHMKSTDLDNEPVRADSGITYVAATHWSRISNCRYRKMTPNEERQLLSDAKRASEK